MILFIFFPTQNETPVLAKGQFSFGVPAGSQRKKRARVELTDLVFGVIAIGGTEISGLGAVGRREIVQRLADAPVGAAGVIAARVDPDFREMESLRRRDDFVSR
jgi:hypothetical protein